MATCVAVFAYQVSLDRNAATLIVDFGFVPARLTQALAEGGPALQAALLTAISAQFLHAGWIHVLGNLVYLRVFGDNVEARMGSLLYLAFYFVSGAVGLGAQYSFDPQSPVPIVGASGAIAGVLGTYIVLFPSARIVTLFPVLIFLTFVEVPAALFLGVWGLQQLLNGLLAFEGATDRVAWFAHIGGFVFGLLVGIIARIWRRYSRSAAP
ncbi:MAG: rhomboid family intramembrane serine protease [Myxococcota bacterium]